MTSPSSRPAAIGGSILLHAAFIAWIFWTSPQRRPQTHDSAVLLEMLDARPTAAPDRNTPPPPNPMLTPTRQILVALPLVPLPEVTAPQEVETNAISQPTPQQPAVAPPAQPPAEYVALLAQRLARVKHYPKAARARRQEGTVLLFFELERSGKLLTWRIARSSGSDALDAEVSDMVAAAAPFPPFPESMGKAAESFLVPIEFALN